MAPRVDLDGPTLRQTRKAHGYTSARLLADATGLTPRQIYHLETGQTTVAEKDYLTLINVFGLEPGALKATGTPCPHCGHAAQTRHKPYTVGKTGAGQVTNAA